jgi:hypothetical protein
MRLGLAHRHHSLDAPDGRLAQRPRQQFFVFFHVAHSDLDQIVCWTGYVCAGDYGGRLTHSCAKCHVRLSAIAIERDQGEESHRQADFGWGDDSHIGDDNSIPTQRRYAATAG